MPSTTAAGTGIAISAGSPAVQSAAAYGALSYTEIGGVESIGGFGAATEVVTFQPLKGPQQKYKGPTNYGSLTPSMAVDDADAGQALLAVASAPSNAALYAIRVTKPDGSLRYFQVRVFGMPETIGAANSMITAAPVLEINTPIIKVAASVGPAPTLTMTQLASPNRIYQRQTTTGGGQSKGQGSIDVQVSASGAGTLYARTRAVSGGAVLQSAFSAGSVASGAQKVTVPGIDARLGWFYLDLSLDGVTWQQGTTPVGMGRIVAVAGQSQAVRQIAKMPSYTGTMASLGVTISPNTSVFARYSDTNRSLTTPAWAVPADASNYDSTFAAEFLRRQVDAFGVNAALIGHAVGSTQIATWTPGTTNNTDLTAVLDAAGGFEAFYWHQGGDDTAAGTTDGQYRSRLTAIFNDLVSHNAARGASFAKYVTAMATRLVGGTGTAAQVALIRGAARRWATDNGGTYLEPRDVVIVDDVHQGQAGSITLAQHLYRATRAELTLSADNGPTLTSATRAAGSADVVLTFALPSGATALAMVGAPAGRFMVANAGTTTALALDGTTPIAVSGSTVTLKLASAPANTQALDVYVLPHPDPSGSLAGDLVFDNRTDGDGITRGRHVTPTPLAVTAAAPGGAVQAPFRDSFTDTAGTALTAHTGETGHTWSATAGTMSISSAGTALANGAAATSLSNFDPGATASFVEGVMVYRTGTQALWLLARGSGTNSWYQFGAQPGANTPGWYIGKTVAGSFTTMGTASAETFVDGQSYTVRAELNGSTLRLLVNGVERVVVTDTAVASSGLVGIRTGGSGTTVTTGAQWDSISAGAL